MEALHQNDIAQWNHLHDINDVHPLDDDDRACLDAVRDVLERHNRLDRFGVNLLHKHFEMASDEVLVENVDEEKRVLVTRPFKVSVLGEEMASAVETQWHWQRDENGILAQICVSRCFPGNWESPSHANKHTGW